MIAKFQNVQFFPLKKQSCRSIKYPPICLIYRHFKSWLKSFFRSKYLHENITSCQWNYYAIFFPTLEENQIVIEMNRNSQNYKNKIPTKTTTESTFKIATTPQKTFERSWLFFLLFAHPNSWSFSNQKLFALKKSLPKS